MWKDTSVVELDAFSLMTEQQGSTTILVARIQNYREKPRSICLEPFNATHTAKFYCQPNERQLQIARGANLQVLSQLRNSDLERETRPGTSRLGDRIGSWNWTAIGCVRGVISTG